MNSLEQQRKFGCFSRLRLNMEKGERERGMRVWERERAVLLHGCMVIRGRELPEAHGRRATVADIYRTHRRWDTG